MQLEDQVCSLELAKELKELGVKQDSLFYWSNIPDGMVIKPFQTGYGWMLLDYQDDTVENASAFTVAELGEMLPRMYSWYEYAPPPCGWKVQYEDKYVHKDSTEANARAKCLIHLIKEGIVKL